MTQMLAGEIVFRVTFWICLLYPALGVFWPWWKSAIGVTVIAESAAFALLLFPQELRYAFGVRLTGTGWAWFELGCFAALPAVLLWRAAAIYLAQRRGAHG